MEVGLFEFLSAAEVNEVGILVEYLEEAVAVLDLSVNLELGDMSEEEDGVVDGVDD